MSNNITIDIILVGAAAPTFVGKLYIEYWASRSEEYGRALKLQRHLRFRRVPILPRL